MHRLALSCLLIIGGVQIPCERGLLDHSDADVLPHTVVDSLLEAAALGNLGVWFLDAGPEQAGANNLKLLRRTCELVGEKGYQIENIGAMVMAQAPKSRPYIAQAREYLVLVCGIKTDAVSVKATTEEHLGFTREGQGIAAHIVCLLRQKNKLSTHLPIAYFVNKDGKVMCANRPVILLGPTIYAMKSRDILFHYGVKSCVERTSRMQDRLGCGYGIYVPGRIDQAKDILIHSDVRVLGRPERASAVWLIQTMRPPRIQNRRARSPLWRVHRGQKK